MPTKRVRVHYRRFHRSSEPLIAETLSLSVAQALQHKVDGVPLDTAAKLRTYPDPDYGSILLNGRKATRTGDVYGELVRFREDTHIPLLMQNASNVAELEVRELVKPNDAEVLRGMSFFLIRGDHVLIVEQDLTTSVLERYLYWLLCERTQIATRNGKVQLLREVLLDDSAHILKDVNSINLRPPPVSLDDLRLDPEGSFSVRATGESPTDVWGVLQAAHFDTGVIEKIAGDYGATIEINLSVSLKTGRKKLTLKGDEALAMLRHIPDEELVLKGSGMQRNRGRLERLSVEADIEHRGNILIRSEAWRALQTAATSYRDAGLIE
ncbi:hypothetical protein [Microvirga puerhi]|uniref:Uncharacterized protein n=1 Tax=Microvirga puerhi TaxID=2876078 RepID=A0ABS7VUD3_9HYPH|nr:hypothetical protein [Microvirga puerhi]MBZ6079187.1 hypothetical protein [Microvirga puerhi]